MGQRRSPLEVRVVAFLISAAERGSTSQAAHVPLSTAARMVLATVSFGAALTTLADSALSASSFHHSGLTASAHRLFRSKSKAIVVASAQSAEPRAHRMALLGLEVPLRSLHL